MYKFTLSVCELDSGGEPRINLSEEKRTKELLVTLYYPLTPLSVSAHDMHNSELKLESLRRELGHNVYSLVNSWQYQCRYTAILKHDIERNDAMLSPSLTVTS